MSELDSACSNSALTLSSSPVASSVVLNNIGFSCSPGESLPHPSRRFEGIFFPTLVALTLVDVSFANGYPSLSTILAPRHLPLLRRLSISLGEGRVESTTENPSWAFSLTLLSLAPQLTHFEFGERGWGIGVDTTIPWASFIPLKHLALLPSHLSERRSLIGHALSLLPSPLETLRILQPMNEEGDTP